MVQRIHGVLCILCYILVYTSLFINLWLLVICALLQDYPYFPKMYQVSCLSAVWNKHMSYSNHCEKKPCFKNQTMQYHPPLDTTITPNVFFFACKIFPPTCFSHFLKNYYFLMQFILENPLHLCY